MTVAPIRLGILARPNDPPADLGDRLRPWGCRSYLCGSTNELATVLDDGTVDLVMVDLAVDGSLALIQSIRADPARRHLPIVAMVEAPSMALAVDAIGLGIDDVLLRPVDDTELYARIRSLARLAALAREVGRREAVMAEFGMPPASSATALPTIERTGILLVGPASNDQVQVMTALGGGTTAAYADELPDAIELLRPGDIDVVLIAAHGDCSEVRALCRGLRQDSQLFDLPVLLIVPAAWPEDRSLPFRWGVSDLVQQPFQPEVLRLRVQGWVRQQRLRRRLRLNADHGTALPATLDRLTGLYSHGFLHAYIDAATADDGSPRAPLSVASFDVVKMSVLNHVHGYATGDRLLAEIGRIIARSCRAIDLPARYQGDRFCIVLNGTDAEAGRIACRRIATALTETPLEVGIRGGLQVALRAGVGQHEPADRASMLLQRTVDRLQPFQLRQAS